MHYKEHIEHNQYEIKNTNYLILWYIKIIINYFNSL